MVIVISSGLELGDDVVILDTTDGVFFCFCLVLLHFFFLILFDLASLIDTGLGSSCLSSVKDEEHIELLIVSSHFLI